MKRKIGMALWGLFGFALLVRAESLPVGIYVGEGTTGLSAARWTEIVHFAPDLMEVPLDAADFGNGAFTNCAAVILPHGDADAMAKALGETGRTALREYIRAGGNCLASNGGARLLASTGDRERVGVLPYAEGEGFGRGSTDELHLNYAAELATPYRLRRADSRRLAWDEGVPFVPASPLPDAAFKVAARLRGNLNLASENLKSLRNQICDVYGTYGKGRVWATMVHSELTPSNLDITKMVLGYVLGRDVSWNLPVRKPKQLAVSVIVDGAVGAMPMKALMKAVDDSLFDVAIIEQLDYDGFWLRHSDAVVKASKLDDAAIRRLHALQKSPEKPAKILARKKVAKPVKAVLYCGPGVGDSELFNFATILDDSPKYTVECQDGTQIVNGSLKGRDFILVAGGNTGPIYWWLQPGEQALKAWLREGGTYYGACAGSIVTLQKSGNFQTGLGLVPFTYRASPYRGHSHPTITFNEDAKEWGLKNPRQRVLYWGGPEHLAHEPIEDTDVKVLARFDCESIDTYGINSLEMKDWSAVVGGRIGKGRIVSTAVHPEEEETQFHLVYAALRYLHGDQPKPEPINRRRGALTVGYYMPFQCSPAQMEFALKLRRDTRFDVRPQSGHMDISGYARHLDVYVFGNSFKDGRLQAETVDYLSRGGRALFISPAHEQAHIRELTKDFPHITIVETHDQALEELIKLAKVLSP